MKTNTLVLIEMTEKFLQLLNLVLEELNRDKKDVDELNLSEFIAKGFSEEDIQGVLSLLEDMLKGPPTPYINVYNRNEDSFRVLNDLEADLFNKETWGEIINLHQVGIMTNDDIESLIDWATIMGIDKMSKQQLVEYLSSNVFKFPNEDKPGSFIVSGNRSIN